MAKDAANEASAVRGSEEVWLEAAHAALVEQGVEAVKIQPLARALGLSRTSFYWHFADREALLTRLIEGWRQKNTGNLIAQTELFAESIAEAMFNLFDCWIDDALFDARLDQAVRDWAWGDPELWAIVTQADADRIAALDAMFLRFGFTEPEAGMRARTVIFAQTGYIAMALEEPLADRLARMPGYVTIYTGQAPSEAEIARFQARHAGRG